jgi:LPS-assembly protein
MAYGVSLMAWSGDKLPDDLHLRSAQADWQPLTTLNRALAQDALTCDGVYVDPYQNAPEPDPAATLITLEAGRADMNDQQVLLDNGVSVQQGPRELHSQRMYFDKATERAELSGNVLIRQSGSLILAESADVNMTANEARFTEASFLAHKERLRGGAGLIAQPQTGVLLLERGSFTSCEPTSRAWLLTGQRLTLDSAASQGSGQHILLWVGGIPVFYLPYIRFPLGSQRQTGWLTPSLGSRNGGLDIALPWYWNIAPNQDATFTPRYLSGEGSLLETEYRHAGLISANNLQTGWLVADKQTEPKAPGESDNRWLAQWQHTSGITRPWRAQVQFGRASDKNYLRDLSTASFAVANETYLTQSAQWGLQLPNWALQASLFNTQNLLLDVDDAYRRLPQLKADGHYRLQDLELRLQHEYVRFDHRQTERLTGSPILTGDRARIDYRLGYRQEETWHFFRPQLGITGMGYQLDPDALKAGVTARPLLSSYYSALDFGLIFEDATRRQTLTPRLFYLYRPYENHAALLDVTTDGQDVNFDTAPMSFGYHQLFRTNRFTGGDRLEDTNQLTIGFSHHLLAPSGDDIWQLQLGQVIYFDDRKVTLGDAVDESQKKSDIAAEWLAFVGDHWELSASQQWGIARDKLMRASLGVNYRDNGLILNLDYRFARSQPLIGGGLSEAIDQFDTSFYLPMNAKWEFYGRALYDLNNNRDLDTFLGFQYGACCFNLRFLARQWLDATLAQAAEDSRRPYDQGLFFEVELRGLGSSGNRISRLIEDSILGLEPDSTLR